MNVKFDLRISTSLHYAQVMQRLGHFLPWTARLFGQPLQCNQMAQRTACAHHHDGHSYET